MANAPDCGSGIRGFNPLQSPHKLGYSQEVKASDFDSDTGGSNPPSPAIKSNYLLLVLTTPDKSSKIIYAFQCEMRIKW